MNLGTISMGIEGRDNGMGARCFSLHPAVLKSLGDILGALPSDQELVMA